MEIYTSYFYKVRFMEPHMIPISTALWDPKWFHNFQKQDYVWLDKRGVFNGIRAEEFAPHGECENLCRGPEFCSTKDSSMCEFLKAYRRQLDRLDCEEVLRRCEILGGRCKEIAHFSKEPIYIFLVHEAPQNPCSERRIIQEWFKANGRCVNEWNEKI